MAYIAIEYLQTMDTGRGRRVEKEPAHESRRSLGGHHVLVQVKGQAAGIWMAATPLGRGGSGGGTPGSGGQQPRA